METCYFCQKGILENKNVTVDFRWGSKLIVIEEVPAKVSNECGEKYYSASMRDVAAKLLYFIRCKGLERWIRRTKIICYR